MVIAIPNPGIISRPPLVTGPVLDPIGSSTDWQFLTLAAQGGEIRMNEFAMASSFGGANECTGGYAYRDFDITAAGIDQPLTGLVDGNPDNGSTTMGAFSNPHHTAWGYVFSSAKAISQLRIQTPTASGALDGLPLAIALRRYDATAGAWKTVGVKGQTTAYAYNQTKTFDFTGEWPPSTGRANARAWRALITAFNGGFLGWGIMARFQGFAMARTPGGPNVITNEPGCWIMPKNDSGSPVFSELTDGNSATHVNLARTDFGDGRVAIGFVPDTPGDMQEMTSIPHDGSFKDFKVQYTNDLVTWNDVLTVTGNTSYTAGTPQTWTF